MKTVKFTSAIVTFSLVIFMSVASIANSEAITTGDLTKSGKPGLAITNSSEMDFSFLRFDVTKFSSKNEEADLLYNSLDFIRFDVNEFVNETGAMELPLNNEFEYLSFDVNRFTESNPGDFSELPVNEFSYLRFDVNAFAGISNGAHGELPVTE